MFFFELQFKQVRSIHSKLYPLKIYSKAYDSMLKEREAEAKLARAREAREKADKER